jgi:hypothetical protein
LALLADNISVVVFCTVGRRSHAEGRTAAGIAENCVAVSGRRVHELAGGALRPRL